MPQTDASLPRPVPPRRCHCSSHTKPLSLSARNPGHRRCYGQYVLGHRPTLNQGRHLTIRCVAAQKVPFVAEDRGFCCRCLARPQAAGRHAVSYCCEECQGDRILVAQQAVYCPPQALWLRPPREAPARLTCLALTPWQLHPAWQFTDKLADRPLLPDLCCQGP